MRNPLEAGSLNQRITFQAKTQTPDGIGGLETGWANIPSFATVWAAVKVMGGREAIDAARLGATSMYLFTIRNRTDIDELCRIVWKGSNFNIVQIKREGEHPLNLTIMAERGTSS